MNEPVIFCRGYLGRLSFGLLLAASVLIIFVWITGDLLKDLTEFVDKSVRSGVQQLEFPAFTKFLWVVTRLGSTVYLTVLGLVICLVFILLEWRRELAIFLIAMAGQVILHYGAKAVFQRPRPAPFIGLSTRRELQLSVRPCTCGVLFLYGSSLDNHAAR